MAEVKVAPATEVAKGQSQTTAVEPQTSAPRYGFHPAFMRQFAEELDQFFDAFGLRLPTFFGRGRELLRREVGLIPAEWSPQVDIHRKDGNLIVRADLPGMTKNDIKVEVTEDTLTIQGERKQEQKEEREGYTYNECRYGSFYRSIPLPAGVDTTTVTADFRDGVLEVAVPMPPSPESRSRCVEVQERK